MVGVLDRCNALMVVMTIACADDPAASDDTTDGETTSASTGDATTSTSSSDSTASTASSDSTGSASSSSGVAPTGACDGPATDDYWHCLMELDMGAGGVNIGQQFRSQSELAAAGGGEQVTYCFAGNTEADGSGTPCTADDYGDKQDAAKVVIPAGRHSIAGQPRPAIGKRDGDILITWDSWNAPEWYLGRSCADDGAIGAQKTFQVSAPPEGNASRWIEVRQLYSGRGYLGDPVAGWNPVTSLTEGTDIATVDARPYGQIGAATAEDSVVGQLADFVIKKSTWTRYWVLVEIDQGDAWTCGEATGAFDLVSIWLADENQMPILIHRRAEMETTRLDGVTGHTCTGGETIAEPLRDDIVALWFEYNSSEGGCPDGGLSDRIGYFRNFAALHTPTAEGVVVGDDASIVVAGTEVLLRPIP